MRNPFLVLMIPLMLSGCIGSLYQRSRPYVPTPPWDTVQLVQGGVLVSFQAVTPREIGRFVPPDYVDWPDAVDFKGQTLWVWDDDKQVLYAGSAGSYSVYYYQEGDENSHEDAGYYRWIPATGSIEWTMFEPQPPDNVWPPIPYYPTRSDLASQQCHDDIIFHFVGTGGRSSLETETVNGLETQGKPIVDALFFHNEGAYAGEWHEPAFNEFSLDEVMRSANPQQSTSLAFRSFRTFKVEAPLSNESRRERVVHIHMFLCGFQNTGTVAQTEALYGVQLTGFIAWPGPEIYFFVGESSYDSNEYTFVAGDFYLNREVLAFPAYRHPDFLRYDRQTLKITGRIPAVQWQDTWVVFAEWGEVTPSGWPFVAIKMNLDNLSNTHPTIIWASTLPDFMNDRKLVVPIGSDNRPYIICLDSATGRLTIFDPLLGSIVYEGQLELADCLEDGPFASFCVNFEPDPMRPIIFIHDPNANEIIELELDVDQARYTGTTGSGDTQS